MTAEERVSAFVAWQIKRANVWGVSDCSLRLGDWTMAAIGVDAAAHLRGLYATRLECARLLRARGGLVEVVDDCAARAGLTRPPRGDEGVWRPSAGAVGVLGDPARPVRQWGALFDGTFWVIFEDRAASFVRAVPLTAWEVL